ncbi:alpha-ketoacid dehydrogenase subunit beta [Streptomyces johnsoniae]|uniref:Transketolase C-terminal domain-containing protein n=1 Tax=Streptomyces johnsoniae TaxID=3075532 RepID=A0ABU2S382_9ACTN|nr:transketolase C-terminal domain-containing protein [Streptomyces sp. DSM 41886]MDT0443453.1 transketolase C-terminal domain-containing protein [Streptomyces sp. DSM 41886]
MRTLTYAQAISEATVQCMEADPAIIVAGQSVDEHAGVWGTTNEAYKRFGKARVIDIPNSENAFAGIAVGAATMGLRPMVVHTRADFMFLAMDAIINLSAKWRYMYGNKRGAPVVHRGIVGRGRGEGATHSQSLHALFGHFPGLYVATPASPADAKGLLVTALQGDTPVVLLENRGLYDLQGEVPQEPVAVPFGRGRIVRAGNDVTIVAASHMVYEADRAADALAPQGVSAEVVDVRSIRPFDDAVICESVAKTGRLVVADTSWARYGFTSEVAAVVAENVPGALKVPVRRVTPPDCPSPVSAPLENAFNPDAETVTRACLEVLGLADGVVPKMRDVMATFNGPY